MLNMKWEYIKEGNWLEKDTVPYQMMMPRKHSAMCERLLVQINDYKGNKLHDFWKVKKPAFN